MPRLEVQGLTVRFGHGRTALTAVRGVGLSIPPGGTLGLVGESGSGKSTVARAIVRLSGGAVSGSVRLDGEEVSTASGAALQRLRRRVQMVFQDPYSSMNPMMRVGESIREAVATHRRLSGHEQLEEVERLLNLVGLDPAMRDQYPHQFSGGQRQRIAIARALAVQPDVLILDEVTSALDVSVQATILNLLRDLQRRFQLSYLFISHNLSVVRYMSDSVAVMYLGKMVESSPAEELFSSPRHPYTRALIQSIPQQAEGLAATETRLGGEIPDPRFPPSGCPFRTRCPEGPAYRANRERCADLEPLAASESTGERWAACHFPIMATGSE